MIDENIRSKAARTTETRDLHEISGTSGNLYKALAIISKRSEQINTEIREELHEKLEEFSSVTDSLEEIFENKEQIEVSRHYEKMPKPMAIAIEEWREGKIYYRDPESENNQ
jgi:DNA-directed RNA polymerase subunit K/omega